MEGFWSECPSVNSTLGSYFPLQFMAFRDPPPPPFTLGITNNLSWNGDMAIFWNRTLCPHFYFSWQNIWGLSQWNHNKSVFSYIFKLCTWSFMSPIGDFFISNLRPFSCKGLRYVCFPRLGLHLLSMNTIWLRRPACAKDKRQNPTTLGYNQLHPAKLNPVNYL